MLLQKIKEFDIPVVGSHNPVEDPESFLQSIRDIEGSEGVIIVWENGHRVKCKGDWYCFRHKAKDSILREGDVIEMLLDEKLDDVKPVVGEDDLVKLENFENQFWQGVANTATQWENINASVHNQFEGDRKRFALEMAPKIDPFLRAAIFKFWESSAPVDFRQVVIDTIRKNIGNGAKIDAARRLWGGTVYEYDAVGE